MFEKEDRDRVSDFKNVLEEGNCSRKNLCEIDFSFIDKLLGEN